MSNLVLSLMRDVMVSCGAVLLLVGSAFPQATQISPVTPAGDLPVDVPFFINGVDGFNRSCLAPLSTINSAFGPRDTGRGAYGTVVHNGIDLCPVDKNSVEANASPLIYTGEKSPARILLIKKAKDTSGPHVVYLRFSNGDVFGFQHVFRGARQHEVSSLSGMNLGVVERVTFNATQFGGVSFTKCNAIYSSGPGAHPYSVLLDHTSLYVDETCEWTEGDSFLVTGRLRTVRKSLPPSTPFAPVGDSGATGSPHLHLYYSGGSELSTSGVDCHGRWCPNPLWRLRHNPPKYSYRLQYPWFEGYPPYKVEDGDDDPKLPWINASPPNDIELSFGNSPLGLWVEVDFSAGYGKGDNASGYDLNGVKIALTKARTPLANGPFDELNEFTQKFDLGGVPKGRDVPYQGAFLPRHECNGRDKHNTPRVFGDECRVFKNSLRAGTDNIAEIKSLPFFPPLTPAIWSLAMPDGNGKKHLRFFQPLPYPMVGGRYAIKVEAFSVQNEQVPGATFNLCVKGAPVPGHNEPQTTPPGEQKIFAVAADDLNNTPREQLSLSDVVVSGATTDKSSVKTNGLSVTFTPPAGTTGVVTIRYKVTSPCKDQSSSEGVVTVDVRAGKPPVAVDDPAVVMHAGKSIVLDVRANDSDPDGTAREQLTITNPTVVSGAAIGSVQVQSDGKLVFTAAAGQKGTATVRYWLTDPQGLISNPGQVQVVVVVPGDYTLEFADRGRGIQSCVDLKSGPSYLGWAYDFTRCEAFVEPQVKCVGDGCSYLAAAIPEYTVHQRQQLVYPGPLGGGCGTTSETIRRAPPVYEGGSFSLWKSLRSDQFVSLPADWYADNRLGMRTWAYTSKFAVTSPPIPGVQYPDQCQTSGYDFALTVRIYDRLDGSYRDELVNFSLPSNGGAVPARAPRGALRRLMR